MAKTKRTQQACVITNLKARIPGVCQQRSAAAAPVTGFASVASTQAGESLIPDESTLGSVEPEDEEDDLNAIMEMVLNNTLKAEEEPTQPQAPTTPAPMEIEPGSTAPAPVPAPLAATPTSASNTTKPTPSPRRQLPKRNRKDPNEMDEDAKAKDNQQDPTQQTPQAAAPQPDDGSSNSTNSAGSNTNDDVSDRKSVV